MSRDLGTLKLPNGGALTVSAYVGPGRSQRLQFTLEQGEGGITAYGNTNADGVAELLGWLETWLLEQGRRSVPNEVPGPAPAFAISRDKLARSRSMLERARGIAGSLARRLEDGDTAKAYRTAEELADLAAGALSLLPALELPAKRDDVRLSSVDGPSPLAVHEELHGKTAGDELRSSLERAAQIVRTLPKDDSGRVEELEEILTPASDSLEANDVVSSLEDFGKVGEERDAAFTAALERRRRYRGAHLGTLFNSIRALKGRAEELEKYLSERDLEKLNALEYGPLVGYCADVVRAHLELREVLDALLEGA